MTLETQRLILREWNENDVEDIFEGLNNIEVSKWLASVPYPYTKEDAEKWIKFCIENAKKGIDRTSYDFAVELKVEKKVIGGIGLDKINKFQGTAGGGIWINTNYHGQGYGAEAFGKRIDFAFNELKLRRLENGFLEENPSSFKMQEKFGYKIEGMRRKAFRCMADGEIKDEYITGLLKDEWIERGSDMQQIGTLNYYVRGLLKFTVLQYMLDTICENPKLAKIFVDEVENPNCCIVSFNHLLFFGGNPTKDCLRFLSNNILTRDKQHIQKVFYMLYPDEVWENSLKGLFSDNRIKYERSLYRHNPKYTDRLPSCDNIVEITAKLMTSTTDNLEMIANEVISTGTYDSIEDYLMRGIGYAPIIENKVCGFCTSEYQSKNAIAIGIEVREEYQRQGYAKAMTRAFLYKASNSYLTVYWECWKNNLASANTALSCGFEKIADYPILFIKL